ncbi:hypothetical protein AVEN_97-1 [Araneus ventricosus]|uniref:Uncharacterized protein n=1 Tax=Araneus ventricosus TaxID=182803 RepID=A0A4Y2QZH7_ARAVE|nr:hypothetical protein AVEN_97-1 [Araneus ventricosus]
MGQGFPLKENCGTFSLSKRSWSIQISPKVEVGVSSTVWGEVAILEDFQRKMALICVLLRGKSPTGSRNETLFKRKLRARESLDKRFQRRSARNTADSLRRARARRKQQMANRMNSQVEANVTEQDCGMMMGICNFCQALYWRNELNSSIKYTKCCHDGVPSPTQCIDEEPRKMPRSWSPAKEHLAGPPEHAVAPGALIDEEPQTRSIPAGPPGIIDAPQDCHHLQPCLKFPGM